MNPLDNEHRQCNSCKNIHFKDDMFRYPSGEWMCEDCNTQMRMELAMMDHTCEIYHDVNEYRPQPKPNC